MIYDGDAARVEKEDPLSRMEKEDLVLQPPQSGGINTLFHFFGYPARLCDIDPWGQ